MIIKAIKLYLIVLSGDAGSVVVVAAASAANAILPENE